MSSPLRDDSPAADWRETFSEICDSHRGRLVRWITAIFGARDAEDIAQEALTRLYTRPGLVEETDAAWPWLAVVARNVGRDLARHNSWSTAVEPYALAQVSSELVVVDEVIAREEAARLAVALRSLTQRERSVIRLRDFEGATVAEIAELFGTNENAVRQQLFRARRRLANVYVGLGGDSRIGALVAACGLRLRELARRFTAMADHVGAPGVAALAALVPGAVAAVVAATLGLGGASRGTAYAVEDGTVGGLVERGVDRLAAVGISLDHGAGRDPGRLPVTPPGPDGPPLLEAEQSAGPARVSSRVQRLPGGYYGGYTDEHEVEVMTPLGPMRISTGGWQGAGGGLLCQSARLACPDPLDRQGFGTHTPTNARSSVGGSTSA